MGDDEQEHQVVINIDVGEEDIQENYRDGTYDEADTVADAEASTPSAMEYAETIAQIDYGCYMKAKTGVAGEEPQKDSFPFFTSSTKWTCLLWDGSPNDWRLVSFDGKRPDNIYDTEEVFKASYVLLSKITEVYLELGQSASFRLYQGQEVTRCTPQPESREHVESWVNAIFAAMQVQGMGADSEGEVMDGEEGIAAFDEDLLHLRDRFIESVEEAMEMENAQQGGEIAFNDDCEEGEMDIESGAGGRRRRGDSFSSQHTSKSAYVDLGSIYGHRAPDTAADGGNSSSKGCCITS